MGIAKGQHNKTLKWDVSVFEPYVFHDIVYVLSITSYD